MTSPDAIVFLTWPDGPVFRLGRTNVAVWPPRTTRERLLAPVPFALRLHWLARHLWLRWLCGPHYFHAVDLQFRDGELSYRAPNGRVFRWRVPQRDYDAAAAFVDELRRRAALRTAHRVERGGGRSWLPAALALAFVALVVRRAVR